MNNEPTLLAPWEVPSLVDGNDLSLTTGPRGDPDTPNSPLKKSLGSSTSTAVDKVLSA
jgi:hypothetical protein